MLRAEMVLRFSIWNKYWAEKKNNNKTVYTAPS